MSEFQGISFGNRPAGQPASQPNAAAETIRRLQGRNNGLDFAAATQAYGAQQLQEPLPGLDFMWTWTNKEGTQRGWKLTFNSARGGLNLQRGRLEQGHTRQAESALISDVRDEIILPFKTVAQANEQHDFATYVIVHTEAQDRAIMASTLGDPSIYAETSTSDATVIKVGTAPAAIFSLATVMIQGQEHLLVLHNGGATFYRLYGAALSQQATVSSFNVVTAVVVAAGGVALGGGSINTGIGIPAPAWGSGQSTEAFVGMAVIQSPLPGNPLIVRSSNAVLLIPVEPTTANASPYTQNGSKMLTNVGLGVCFAIGFQRVGNLPPAAYWLEQSGGQVAAPNYRARIASVNAYGTDYQVHHLGMTKITGAAGDPERGALYLTDGYRVTEWTGREEDLQIFADETPVDGYKLYCTGLYVRDGQLFAEVDDLPYATGTTATGRIRSSKRRYDFDLHKWFQISEWLTLAEEGLISWANGQPVPVGSGTTYGYMSAYGAPDLPFGPVTRAMHNYALQARYTADLSTSIPLNASADKTWFHKYQQPAATNPYSLRGGDQPFATSGVLRWPALIFPPGYEYCDKYVDYIETGGQDSGGASSSWTVRVGEGGHMDDTNPGPLGHAFESPLNHQSRRREWNQDATSLLFPQVEIELTRGSSNATPQGLPFTIYGHVDLPEPLDTPPLRTTGRAAG